MNLDQHTTYEAIPTNSRFKNLTSLRFGRFTVLGYLGKNAHRQAMWEVECTCGSIRKVVGCSLSGGHSTSCGCIATEKMVVASTKHGHGKRSGRSSEMTAWKNMKMRCCNPKTLSYNLYGGRGIQVCERWLNSFENFLADMGEKPVPKRRYTLERKDTNGNYEPANCIWATHKEQARNLRCNRIVEHEGDSKTLAEWSEISGVEYNKLRKRLNRGWAIGAALVN